MKRLLKFEYSPGYSDMLGAKHMQELKKLESGEWVIISSDRPQFNMPLKITTYAVDAEALLQFERFLNNSKVLQLTERKDSNMFATDYSCWEYEITMEEMGDESQEDSVNSRNSSTDDNTYSLNNFQKESVSSVNVSNAKPAKNLKGFFKAFNKNKETEISPTFKIGKNCFYNITEYKNYSDEDYELLDEINRQFKLLFGKIISEEEEKSK